MSFRRVVRRVFFSAAAVAICWALLVYQGILHSDLPAIRSVAAALSITTPSAPPTRDTGGPVSVTAAPVRVEEVPIYLSAIGTVQAYNTVGLKTRVDGEIINVLFEEGQDVNADDVLVIIDPRPLAAQLRQQEAALLKDKAQLEGAILDLQRYESLVLKKNVTQQQVDQQRALVEQYRAQVQSDEAQVEYAKTQLEYTTIRAPISGRTGIRQVDQGNIIRATDNTTIVVLTQLRPISVVFTIAATAAAQSRLTPGRVNLAVTAHGPDGVAQLDRGKVELVDNQVDPTTGTIKLKASFPNTELRLWPGNFVNGRIVVDTRQGLTVPSVAVRRGPRGDFVWTVRQDKTVEAKGVQVVQAFGGRTLIERGVTRGDQVVTDGYFRLENGTRVEISQGAPAAPGAGAVTASGRD